MQKRATVALIGAGGIGFRHFQSLLDMDYPLDLIVVDLQEEALKKAQGYAFGKLGASDIKATYQNGLGSLPDKIDVLIIATSSLPRREIFEQAAERAKIDYVIFEKFMFPQEEDYACVGRILEKKGIKAYVNTPCRLYPGYVGLKKQLEGEKHIDVLVSGSNWGLSCNAIHVIDAIGYLMGTYGTLATDASSLDSQILKSKREHYIEFNGRLVCRLGDAASIVMDSFSSGEAAFTSTIFAGDAVYTVCEPKQQMWVSRDGVTQAYGFPIYYQSGLTSQVVGGLLTGQGCGLTKYQDSVQWHVSLLRAFLKKYNDATGNDGTLCPIT